MGCRSGSIPRTAPTTGSTWDEPPEFSPSEHVARIYRMSDIDYLVISHPDKDHLEDLPQFRAIFGDPRVLCRNKSLPDADMFGQRAFRYQEEYADLHNRFTSSVPQNESPTNPDYNGGVRYAIHSLDHGTRVNGSTILGSAVIEGNDTSLVVMLLYQGVLFVCPGTLSRSDGASCGDAMRHRTVPLSTARTGGSWLRRITVARAAIART